MLKQIENFTLKEFIKQDNDLIKYYATVLSYIKPVKTKKDVIHLSLKEVENIRTRFNSMEVKDVVKVISIVQDIKKADVYDIKIIKLFGLVASVKEQMNVIHKAEISLSESEESDFRYSMVNGGERMSVFGVYNVLEKLSGGDVLKYKEILKLRYSEVFTVLKMRAVRASIDKDMKDIKAIDKN